MLSSTSCCLRAAALALLALGASAARADVRQVEVPLVVPSAFLERLLVEQVFTEPGHTARAVAAGDPCNEIVLSSPRVGQLGGRLVVTAHGRAVGGFSLGDRCVRPFSWEGEIEADEEAELAPAAPVVRFRVADSRLSGGGGFFDVPAFWDWVKPVVHPRLETLRVDLGPLVAELRRSLPLFAARRGEPAVQRLADSIALAEAKVEERGLVLRLRFDVEEAAPRPAAPPREAALTPEELAAFDEALREWDAFLTFVVKTAGRDTLRPELRAELLAALLDARYELVAALEEPSPDGEDRVRVLFVNAWTRLSPALLELAGGSDGFRWLAFVAAGDALAALDAAGPAFGIEISSDGLRRLARGIAPGVAEDPLHWSLEVDPELRETFDFEAELPALPPAPAGEAPPETEPAEQPESAAPPAPETEPAEPEPAAPPAPDEEPTEEPESTMPPAPETEPEPGAALPALRRLAARLARLWLAPAYAAAPVTPSMGPHTSPLDGFAPRRDDLDEYLPQVAALLSDAAKEISVRGRLTEELRSSFRSLVLATAWQESCWRQYVRRRNQVVPLRSRVGALGLMQVNPRVWRGFYAVDGLGWSIAYNARAGSEILLHYLRDYAIARGEEAVGGPDALARATYAMYHGGPSHLRRYREPKRWRAPLVAVDRAFYAKYRDVVSGNELGVRECFAG